MEKANEPSTSTVIPVMKPKPKRERHNCCVPQCSEVKNTNNHLHTVPKSPARRLKWKIAIKTGKEIGSEMKVCSKHFRTEDYFPSVGGNQKPKLKKTAVPSLFLPLRTHDKVESSPLKRKKQARVDRAAKRALWSNTAGGNDEPSLGSGEECGDLEHSGKESDEGWTDIAEIHESCEKKLKDVGVQIEFESDSSAFVSSITSSDKKLFSVTGIHSVKLLNCMAMCFDKIAPENPHGKFSMCTRDRILLTMMKIKLAINFSALAVLFDLSQQTCANYFYDSVEVLAKVLKCVVFWPDKEDVLKNLPKCFSMFKCTRVVLDCYETPIEKARCISCRVRSWSQYKKNHTVKVSMNSTPSGMVCACTPSFGGRASDKVVTQHTGIYKMCDPMDGIMVDKGYPIDEECQDHMLVLIRPPFVRNKKQFTRAEAVHCARVARARVHVERVIQRVREYHTLKNKIPWNIVPFVDEIVVIVSALVNLGKPILARDKY